MAGLRSEAVLTDDVLGMGVLMVGSFGGLVKGEPAENPFSSPVVLVGSEGFGRIKDIAVGEPETRLE